MINIKNLYFYYKKGTPVLQNISLDINSGVSLLMGENGVGKSTLLHIICGLCFPKSGYCFINDKNTLLRNPLELNDIFFLPEDFAIPLGSSIGYFSSKHSYFYPRFDSEMFRRNLSELNVDIDKPLSEQSFGQRKKAMIAYSLALRTSVLLLDEPTNGLDVSSKLAFRKLLARNISDEQIILISSNSVSEFKNLYDNIILLADKEVLLNEKMESIANKLLFVTSANMQDDALYFEQNINGYSSILTNEDNLESTIDLEVLYRAFTQSEKIKDIFKS